jgi:hypothetical protein
MAALLLLLLIAGCGGSSGASTGADDGGEVTVKTGTLSKADFIRRADAICTSLRSEFLREFSAFFKRNTPKEGATDPEVWLGEVVDEIVVPNYEEKLIPEISSLGAPPSYADEVALFLNVVKQRVAEVKAQPLEMTKTPFPFKKAEKSAGKYGLTGCASSFS